jgi:transcriptional regulator with XRE-family HTH domain
MMQESLARKLRVLRAERGITLQEAEELTGVTRETLGALEHGQRGAYTNTLQKIADGYGTTVGELLEERPPVPLAEASQETGHTEAEVEEEQRPDDEVTRRRIYSGLAEARALLLESTAELWDRLLDRGEDNVDTLRLIEHVTTKEIINHAIDEEEIKELCAPEQRDQLERAEQRLVEADRRVSRAIDAKLPSLEIDKRRAARAERQAMFERLNSPEVRGL